MVAGLCLTGARAPTRRAPRREPVVVALRVNMITPTTSPSISFSIDGDVLHFSGSDMDGWQGTVSSASGLIYFRADPHERHPGGSASNDDTKCQRVR